MKLLSKILVVIILSPVIIQAASRHDALVSQFVNLCLNHIIFIVKKDKKALKTIDVEAIRLATSPAAQSFAKELTGLRKSIEKKDKISLQEKVKEIQDVCSTVAASLNNLDKVKLARENKLSNSQLEEVSDAIDWLRLTFKMLSRYLYPDFYDACIDKFFVKLN